MTIPVSYLRHIDVFCYVSVQLKCKHVAKIANKLQEHTKYILFN